MDQKLTNSTYIMYLLLSALIVFQLSNMTIGIIKFTKNIYHIDIPSNPPITVPSKLN